MKTENNATTTLYELDEVKALCDIAPTMDIEALCDIAHAQRYALAERYGKTPNDFAFLMGLLNEVWCRGTKSRQNKTVKPNGSADMYITVDGKRTPVEVKCGQCDIANTLNAEYVVYTFYFNNSNGRHFAKPVIMKGKTFYNDIVKGGYHKDYKLKGQSVKLCKLLKSGKYTEYVPNKVWNSNEIK